MEIFDFHAHIYPEKIASAAVENVGKFYNVSMASDGLAETLIDIGAEAGIQKFVVHSVATVPKHVPVINRFIQSEVEKYDEFYGAIYDFAIMDRKVNRILRCILRLCNYEP